MRIFLNNCIGTLLYFCYDFVLDMAIRMVLLVASSFSLGKDFSECSHVTKTLRNT